MGVELELMLLSSIGELLGVEREPMGLEREPMGVELMLLSSHGYCIPIQRGAPIYRDASPCGIAFPYTGVPQ